MATAAMALGFLVQATLALSLTAQAGACRQEAVVSLTVAGDTASDEAGQTQTLECKLLADIAGNSPSDLPLLVRSLPLDRSADEVPHWSFDGLDRPPKHD
ncbi:hypothetical protein [Aureimonas sp. SK2]|uniref:hypothetical protein n=1 Tax=Aureimonas sp. SK2 TaxID=3015992 RepID=UPI002444133D|nr:hypothetical protein [Aureimonas sp. SK2]